MGGARRDFFRHPPRRTSKLTPCSAARGDAGTADVRSRRCRSFASPQVAGGHQAEDSSRDLMWYCATSAYIYIYMCVCVSFWRSKQVGRNSINTPFLYSPWNWKLSPPPEHGPRNVLGTRHHAIRHPFHRTRTLVGSTRPMNEYVGWFVTASITPVGCDRPSSPWGHPGVRTW